MSQVQFEKTRRKSILPQVRSSEASGAGGGPRTKDHLYGIHNLSIAGKHRIQQGNATYDLFLKIVRLCLKCYVPVGLENPHTSFLWMMPGLVKLLRTAATSAVDFCTVR